MQRNCGDCSPIDEDNVLGWQRRRRGSRRRKRRRRWRGRRRMKRRRRRRGRRRGEVQKRGEENRSPSLAELCKMQQNTIPPMVDYHVM